MQWASQCLYWWRYQRNSNCPFLEASQALNCSCISCRAKQPYPVCQCVEETSSDIQEKKEVEEAPTQVEQKNVEEKAESIPEKESTPEITGNSDEQVNETANAKDVEDM